MRLKRDISIGLVNSVWSAAVTLASVPVFVHYLGIEAYGIVGFFAAVQGLLQVLDMGLAPTMNREVARFSALGNIAGAANLLRSLASVYWGMACVIGLLIYWLAGPIAARWLQVKTLDSQTVEHGVILLGLVTACRWPIGLYQGVLLGALRVNVASVINMLMIALANGGAIIVLACVSATIEAFFLWQALVGILYAIAMRSAAWRVLAAPPGSRIEWSELKRVGPFALGMSGIAASGIVMTQMDKVILSRLLSLDDFGRYALAGVLASGLYLFVTPTFNIIFPRLSSLAAKSDESGMAELYRTGSQLLSAALFPMAATAAFYSYDLLSLWTRDAQLAAALAPITSLLLVGAVLNGVMHFPYALQLACGATRVPLTINAVLLLLMVPLTTLLAIEYGALGGAMAWAALNFVYLLLGTWLTHRSLLRGHGLSWLMFDIAIPAGIAVVVVWLTGSRIRNLEWSSAANLLMGCLVGAICSAGIMLSTRRARVAVGFGRNSSSR